MLTACDKPDITTWHICISGFLQKEGQRSGIMKLWLQLHRLYASPQTCVAVREWNANWSNVAEHIFQTRNGRPAKILVYAYSWGAGWGFIQLAKQLKQRGMHVRCAVLADPVWRSKWPLFKWLSLTRLPVIMVPDNVDDVRWYFQRANLPSAHEVLAEDKLRTTIAPGIELDGVTHQYADDAEEFHVGCLSAAGEYA